VWRGISSRFDALRVGRADEKRQGKPGVVIVTRAVNT
jgi:hypothetical protein